MSIESARLFWERMKTDENFVKLINGCKDAESRMLCVKAAGFCFTADEAREVSCELSDEEMDMVAGSGTAKCCWSGYIEFIN